MKESIELKVLTTGILKGALYNPSAQFDTASWPALKERVRALFLTQPRAHWCALLEGTDACFAPVLTLDEAANHPHNAARGLYAQTPSGERRTRAAPRFTTLQGAHTHD